MRIVKSVAEIYPFQQHTQYRGFVMTEGFAHRARQTVETKLRALHALSPWTREFLPEAEQLCEEILTLQLSLGLEPHEITLPMSGPELEAWVTQARVYRTALVEERDARNRAIVLARKRELEELKERERLTESGEELQDDLLALYEFETFDAERRDEVRKFLAIRWISNSRRQVSFLPNALDELRAWLVHATQLRAAITAEIVARKTKEEEERRARLERERLEREQREADRRQHEAAQQKLRAEKLATLPEVIGGLNRIVRFKTIQALGALGPGWLGQTRDVLFQAVELKRLGLLGDLQIQLLTNAEAHVKKLEQLWGFTGVPFVPGSKNPRWKAHRAVRHYRHW